MSTLNPAAASLPQTILETARGLVIRDGAANLTISRIASAAGVTKGGVLHHFRNKAALMDAMISADLDEIERAFRKRRDLLQTSTPRGHLEAYALSMMDLAGRNPNPWRSAAALMAVSPGAAATFRTWRREILPPDDHSGTRGALQLAQGVLEGIALSGRLDGVMHGASPLKVVSVLTALPQQ